MDTDWLSYYFSPLVSMWFGIIWLTMWVLNQHNKSTIFMVSKIFISAGLVTLFFYLDWPLQVIFAFSNGVFRTEWYAREWAFRVTLDIYIPYVGMLAALAYIKTLEHRLTDRPEWAHWVKYAIVGAGVAMGLYMILELQLHKFKYNVYHPILSAVPVLAFAVLRNATPYLRSVNSKFFMYFGQCSLETFIIQVRACTLWCFQFTCSTVSPMDGGRHQGLNSFDQRHLLPCKTVELHYSLPGLCLHQREGGNSDGRHHFLAKCKWEGKAKSNTAHDTSGRKRLYFCACGGRVCIKREDRLRHKGSREVAETAGHNWQQPQNQNSGYTGSLMGIEHPLPIG